MVLRLSFCMDLKTDGNRCSVLSTGVDMRVDLVDVRLVIIGCRQALVQEHARGILILYSEVSDKERGAV